MATFIPFDLSAGDQDSVVSREIAKGKAGGKRPKGRGPGESILPELEALAEQEHLQSNRDEGLSYTKPGEVITSTPQDTPGSFVPFDLDEPGGKASFVPFDLSEGKSVRSGGTPVKEKGFLGRTLDTAKKYLPEWQRIPPPEMTPGVVPPARPTTLVPTVGNLLQTATMPFAVARDAVQGVATGQPGQFVGPKEMGDLFMPPGGNSTDWRQNIISGTIEGLDELALPWYSRGVKPPVPTKTPLPTAPHVLTQTQLDMQIAERALATGYPDEVDTLVPTVRRLTGETVFAPSLDPGMHPLVDGRTSRRDALGNKVRLPSQMQQGEYPTIAEGQLPLDMQVERSVLGEHATPQTTFDDYMGTQIGEKVNQVQPGGQGELLGGLFREGRDTVPAGPHVYQPGEQTEMGMTPLRPQRLIIPEHKTGLNAGVERDLLKLLVKPAFTPEEVARHASGWRELGFATEVDRGPAFTPGLEERLAAGEPIAGHAPPKLTVLPTKEEQAILSHPFPSMPERVIPAVTDVMRKYGTLGNNMADMTDWVYGTRARDWSRDMGNLDAALDQAVGKRKFWSKQKENVSQIAGDNVFVKSLGRHWNLTAADEEAIFNHLDSGGVEQVPAKLQPVVDALFEKGSKPASMDPGVQSLLVTDPVTGKKFPVGAPSKFMPHRPVTKMAKDTLNDTHWNALYQRKGGQSLGVSLDEFKARVKAVLGYDQDVVAQKMRGLETARMLDLGALGGSRYQWAKKLGLETDAYRAIAQYNAAARLRGNMAQIEKPMQSILDAIPAEDKVAKEWLSLAHKRIMVHDADFDMTTDLSNTLRGVSHVTDVLMLPLGGLANVSQGIYPVARAGYWQSLKSFGSMLSPADRLIVNNSGARFPAMLNEITKPTGPMATLSSAAFRGYMLHPVDSWTRFFAGHVGNTAIKAYESTLLKNPGSQRMQGLIKELGGDPAEILRTGKISDDTRALMIQKFANGAAGVTDVRGVGLWLTNENPVYKLVNKYKNFSMANAAEINRTVLNAPDVRTGIERGVRLIAGAYTVGGGVNELRKSLTNSLMGNEAPKDKKGAAAILERMALGLGAAHAMFLVQLAHDPRNALASAAVGPAFGLISRLGEDIYQTAAVGPGWRSVDTLSGLGPTGPVLGPLVDKERKKEARKLAYKKSLMDSGFNQ